MTNNPFEDRPTFVSHTSIEFLEVDTEHATGRIEINENHHQPYGIVHGGVYCTFAETLASTAAAVWAMDQGMAGAVGLSNKTDFIRATGDGVLVGEATPIHRGRTHQIWQVFMTREADGKLAAQSQVRLQNMTSTEF